MTKRLQIITVVIFLSYKYPDTSGLSPLGSCQDDELGMGNGYILDRDITSTSVQNTSTPAKNGRLNYIKGSSWCAAVNDSKPYLQIELEMLYIICAVSTQGNSQEEQWVKTYMLQSSKDGTIWTDYQEAGIVKIFSGNFDRNTAVKHRLCSGIVATRLRIVVHEYHGNCCMRVEFYGLPVRSDNLALHKPTAQSSTHMPFKSGYAVDGVKGTDIQRYKCTHTLDMPGSTDPWWGVHLKQPLPVSEVYILNRGDCCGDRLKGFEIRVGYKVAAGGSTNRLCASGLSVPQGKGMFFRCRFKLYGRYVFIRIPGANKVLTLCEVEVYSTIYSSKACQTTGVADRLPDKSFSASSSRLGDEPSKGRLNGNGAWSPSNYNDADFLQIDLGDMFFICAVATQGHPTRDEWTTSYKLHLFRTEWIIYKEKNTETFSGNSRSSPTVKHFLTGPPTARSVRFQPIHYSTYKALRVEVYGIKTPAGIPSTPVIKNKNKEISFTDFNLSWNSPDNNGCLITMYTVYYKAIRSPDKEKSWHRINTTAMTNTLSVLPIDCDTEYEFAVSAWNEFGEGNLSQPWQGKFTTGYPIIVNRAKEVKGSVVVVKWKPCTASLFTIYYREVFSETDKSQWNGVNVSGHEIQYDLYLNCHKKYDIGITAWNSTAETPLKTLNNHGKLWTVKTLGGKPSAPVILNKETQVSGCDVNLRWSLPEDNGCPLTMHTIYYRELQSKNKDSWHRINVTKVTKSEHLLSLKCNTEYAFAVSGWNELGESPISSERPITTIKVTNSIGQTISIVVPVGCGALILIVVGIVCFSKKRKRKIKQCGLETRRRSKSDIVPLLLKETHPQRVIFMEELGQGAFGKVHKGIMRDLPKAEVFFKPREERVEIKEGKVVAIKVLLESAGEEGRNQLLQEIEFMKQIGSHRNVLSMLGYWVKSEPIMLILEYVPHGDLLQWLRNRRQQIKCKNRINKVILKAVSEFADGNNMSDTAIISKISEQKAVNKGDDKASVVENMQGKTNVAYNQDLGGANNIAISVDVVPLCGETRYEGLTSKEGDKSCLEEIELVVSRDQSIGHRTGDRAKEDLNKNTENDEQMEEAKAEVEVVDFFAKDLLCFAWQITKGMDYVASKGFVHRDLAARNVLLGEDRAVKIADFGLLRHTNGGIYEMKHTKKLPIKWMAPESLQNGIYTSKSDVWSFGVLLWELSTMGGIPYPGVSNKQLYKLLQTGYRMEKPDMCSDELYSVMSDCWKEDPDERPSFEQLIATLETMMTADTPYHDFNKLDETQACYSERAQAGSD